jgi:hypothetical protein
MLPWTNDQLLVSIRFRSGLPNASVDEYFDDASLYQLLNEELTAWLTPMVLEMRQEYLGNNVDYPIGQTNTFYIPSSAVGGRLRCVRMCDGQHNPIGPQLEQLDIKDVRNVWIPGIWGSFYIRDNAVILIGNLPQGYFLRLDYESRLSTCVSSLVCTQITAIAGNVVTCSGGYGSAAFVAGQQVDFIAGTTPYTVLGTMTFPTPSGNDATFPSLPSAQGRTVQVGDWLSLTGTSPYIALPQEVFPLVAQWMAVKVQEIKGDQKIEVSEVKYTQVMRQVKGILAPRSLGNKKAMGTMLGQVIGPGIWGWPGL